ncbi:hypothetical protein JTB14_004123 [Gonioctena quinquepunctata]|nr:hypothetical protein JTB14_004123 [Gonioctena quinquepunctata]
MPSNAELKVSRAKALRQTAINRLTLISESAALAKTNSEDQIQFKVRHRDLKKVIKDFEKHHNTILTLLAEDEAKLKEEHEHDEEFVKQCQKCIEDSPHLENENAVGLRNLMDTFTKNLNALKALGLKPEDWDFIITHMLLERLDPSTQALILVIDVTFFQSKTPQQCYEIIKTQKACISCLATAHTINQCTNGKRCRSCSKPHHSLLHFPANAPLSFSENVSRALNSNAPERSEVASEFSDTASHSHINKTTTVGMLMNDREILLSTVLINIKDKFEQWHTIRAILDSGAQSSFISKIFSMKLGLSKFNIAMTLQGLDKMCTSSKSGVHCTIAPLHNTNYTVDLDAIVLDKICDKIPSTSFSIEKFSFSSKLKLADPHFHESGSIDLLLGHDIFPYVLQDELCESFRGNCIPLEQLHILKCNPIEQINVMSRDFRVIGNDENEYSVVNEVTTLSSMMDHDYLPDPTSDYSKNIIAYIAGYVVHFLKKKIVCEDCSKALMSDTKDLYLFSFIKKKEKNGLQYPPTDDQLKGDQCTEVRVKFIRRLEDAMPAGED